MKKYVSLIVCAILSLTALFIPIGSDARSNGKGPGKNETVNNLSELKQALNGKSGTYTFEFDEGVSLDRYSLLIPSYYTVVKDDGTVDNSIKDNVSVYKPNLSGRVDDLHASGSKESKGYGRFADDYDFVFFKDLNMKTGMVTVEYQNDNYAKGDINNCTSEGLSSATELGLDTYEAKQAIKIYSNSGLTQEVMTMDIKDVFIVDGSENGAVKIYYSQGNGFEVGYISSSSQYTYIRIMVFEMDGADFLKVYNNKYVGKYATDDSQFANTAAVIAANKEALKLPTYSVFRYYGSQRTVYNYTSKKTQQKTSTTIESATISCIDPSSGEWKNGYIQNSAAHIVNAESFAEKWVLSSQKGSIKLFVESADCYYAQIDLDITINNGTLKTYRTAYNAELYVKGDLELIKFNHFFFKDGRDAKNKEVIATKEFISKTKINEWTPTEQLKIYLNPADAATAEFVSPLNEFANRYLFGGKLAWAQLIGSVNPNAFDADGDEYTLKNQFTNDFCDVYYTAANGTDYNVYIPNDSILALDRSASLNIDLSDSDRPIIKSNYIFGLSDGNIFKHNTAGFESGSDRTLIIENIGNTVVPSVVVKEIQKAIA
jgi:hypothetical protein